MLHPKLQQKRMGAPRGPTLYERILLFRRLRGERGVGDPKDGEAEIFDNVDGEKAVAYHSASKPDDSPQTTRAKTRQQAYEQTKGRTTGIERSDTSFASVDIADYATLEDDPKRSPSPQPTFTKNASRSPVQTSRQTSAKGEKPIRREIPENATPREIMVEMEDTPRSPRPQVYDNHHTVWADEEEDETKMDSRASSRQEKRRSATPTRKTPTRTPTPKRSPTPSDLNPHTVLPPIHKVEEETHVENTVIRSESRTSVNEVYSEEVKETSNHVQSVKNEDVVKDVEKSITKSEDTTVENVEKSSEKSEQHSVDKSEIKEENISKSDEKSETSEQTSEETTSKISEETTSKTSDKVSEDNSEITQENSETKKEEDTSSKGEITKEKMEETNEKTKEDSKEEKDDTAVIAAATTAAVAAPVAVAATAAVASKSQRKKTPEPEQPQTQDQPKAADAPVATAPAKSAQVTPKPKENQKPGSNTGPEMDPEEREDAIQQLDKLADHKIKSLIDPSKAGEAPKIDKKLTDKVFSKEFQEDLDNFLKSP
ncbi:hypothetical protein SNE40_010239 [Patella caerulea]|uniref:Uncharacterized protein n=1 Tax=Patella caerulea TaxID=87958 RepID=A0AAN8K0K7_PATCE